MSWITYDLVDNFQKSNSSYTPGFQAIKMSQGATNTNLTIANNAMTPTNTPFAGTLINQMSTIGKERTTFPKIYTPANCKAQVDIVGSLISAYGNVATTLGTAISGGDTSGLYPPTLAFDENDTTYWGSLQFGSAVSGTAYIGKDFGVDKKITSVSFLSYSNTNNNINSVLVQSSTNGSSWTTIQTQALTATASATTTFAVTSYTASRYFRLLANANPAAGAYWYVPTITLLDDSPVFQAITIDTITLPTTASATNDFYNGDMVTVASGIGAGQTRHIIAYNGTTKEAALNQAWTTLPHVTNSGYSLYDGIASNIQPGYSIEDNISYVDYPVVNIIASLEKQTGATASPSMGVPMITSKDSNRVQRGAGTGTLSSSQLTVNVTLTTPVDLYSTNVLAWVRSSSATAYTCDVVPTLTTETNLKLDFSGSHDDTTIAYSWEVTSI